MKKLFAPPPRGPRRCLGAVAPHAQDLQPIDRLAAVVDEDVVLQSELDAPSATSAPSTPAARTSCRRATCWNARCSSA